MPPILSPETKRLLSLTGQIHKEEFPYDQVFTLNLITPAGTSVMGALGAKERRVVDVAVDPLFRRMGVASTLVELSKCEEAYVVTEEAAEFWRGIHWYYSHNKVDKGDIVRVYIKTR